MKSTFSKFFLWSESSLWFEYIKKRLHFCSFLKRENRKIFFICLFAPFLSSQWHHYAKNLIKTSISWELSNLPPLIAHSCQNHDYKTVKKNEIKVVSIFLILSMTLRLIQLISNSSFLNVLNTLMNMHHFNEVELDFQS